MDELLRSNRDALFSQARRHSIRSVDAEDALADAGVDFLRWYPGPPGDDALRWMQVVVKHRAWRIARDAPARYGAPPSDTGAAVYLSESSVAAGPEELLERAEEVGEVWEMLKALKADERIALVLFGLGYSYREIAEDRGWTRTKVNRCIAEGRSKVRERTSGGESS